MNGPPSGGWNERARRLAWTLIFLAFALSFAAGVLRALAPVLIIGTVVGAAVYLGVVIARYRKSRW